MKHDDARRPLRADLSRAELAFYTELKRLTGVAGLSCRGLQEVTSSVKSASEESCFYSKSQWARWLNGQAQPPWKAISRLAGRLSDDGIDAGSLPDLWQRAFSPGPASEQAAPLPERPRQLPAAAAYFTGRTAELRELSELAGDATAAGTTLVIAAIVGTAGVGKTALAVHWAHQVSEQFPDGQLYVNLRGFDPTGTPLEPAEAIQGFLDALAVPTEQIPATLEARAALYRSRLVGRQMLIVLDNACDAAQIRPLLPGSPGCLVLVTSRSMLTGLAATDGARLLTLDLLPGQEARDLLARRLGSRLTAVDQEAASDLIALCAGLPLALNIAAARIAAQPARPLPSLIADLHQECTRLDALDAGEPASSIRAAFSCSYTDLPLPAARLFRLLSLHPGPDITVAAAASLTAATTSQTRTILRYLTSVHLLAEHVAGRFAMHDLLRAYATELVHATDAEDSQAAAVNRTHDFYLHSAHTAALCISPDSRPLSLPSPHPGVTPDHPTDASAARTWFCAEHHVLMSVITQSAAIGSNAHAWQITWALGRFYRIRGDWFQRDSILRVALAAAEQAGDLSGQAHMHRDLGCADAMPGCDRDPGQHLQQALILYQELGNLHGQASTHDAWCTVLDYQDRCRDALDHARQALELYRRIGNQMGQANALNCVGWFNARLGRLTEALNCCREALAVCRDSGNQLGEAWTWDSLGYIHHQLGQNPQAIDCYSHALQTGNVLGDRRLQGEVLARLGDAQFSAQDTPSARQSWQQALPLLEELNHPLTGTIRTHLDAHPAPSALP